MDLENKDISNSDLAKEQEAQVKTYQSYRQEEEYWRLKSRSLWLKDGDRNTSVFHRQYRARLSRNHISELTSSDGSILKGNDQLKGAIEAHFQNLFKEEGAGCEEITTNYLSNIPLLVRKEDNATLMKIFSEEEINKVI